VTFPNLVPRVSIVDHEGKLIGRFGDTPAGTELGKFLAPHGLAVDSRGDIYVGEVSWTAWPQIYPGKPHPADLRSLFRKGGMKFFQICNRRTLTAGSNIVKTSQLVRLNGPHAYSDDPDGMALEFIDFTSYAGNRL